LHADGGSLDDWFIAGIELPSGMIACHLLDRPWDVATRRAKVLDRTSE
jgi:hypothetical protein